jgi:hypothetical protein
MTAAWTAREFWWTNPEFSSVDIIPSCFSLFIYHLGVNNRPVGGRSSETYSHPIDMIIIIYIKNEVSSSFQSWTTRMWEPQIVTVAKMSTVVLWFMIAWGTQGDRTQKTTTDNQDAVLISCFYWLLRRAPYSVFLHCSDSCICFCSQARSSDCAHIRCQHPNLPLFSPEDWDSTLLMYITTKIHGATTRKSQFKLTWTWKPENLNQDISQWERNVVILVLV